MSNPLSPKLISQGYLTAQVTGYELNNALNAVGNQLPVYDAGSVAVGIFSTEGVQIGDNTVNISALGSTSGTPGIYLNATHIALSLTDYANNAAALAGGLVVGEQYHTSGTVKIVI